MIKTVSKEQQLINRSNLEENEANISIKLGDTIELFQSSREETIHNTHLTWDPRTGEYSNRGYTNTKETFYVPGIKLGIVKVGEITIRGLETKHNVTFIKPGLLRKTETVVTITISIKFTEDSDQYRYFGFILDITTDKDMDSPLLSALYTKIISTIREAISKYLYYETHPLVSKKLKSGVLGGSKPPQPLQKTNRKVQIKNQSRVVYLNKYNTEYIKYKGEFLPLKKAMRLETAKPKP